MEADDFFDELEHRLVGGYPCLKNEVSAAVLGSGATSKQTAIGHEQIVQNILTHPTFGPRISKRYRGRVRRLMRDVMASCQSSIESRHLKYEGKGYDRKYWD